MFWIYTSSKHNGFSYWHFLQSCRCSVWLCSAFTAGVVVTSPQDKLLPLKMGSLERLFGIILLIQLFQSRACSAKTVQGRFSNLFLNKTTVAECNLSLIILQQMWKMVCINLSFAKWLSAPCEWLPVRKPTLLIYLCVIKLHNELINEANASFRGAALKVQGWRQVFVGWLQRASLGWVRAGAGSALLQGTSSGWVMPGSSSGRRDDEWSLHCSSFSSFLESLAVSVSDFN